MDNLFTVIEAVCNSSDSDILPYLRQISLSKLLQAVKKLKSLANKRTTSPNIKPLTEELLAKSEVLEKFFSTGVENAVGELPSKVDDYRLIDIRLVDGRAAKKTNEAILRRALGERSLAQAFTRDNPHHLDTILDKKDFKPSRNYAHGSIRSFARKHFPEDDQQAVRVAISNGLRFLAIEKELPSSGISGILAFVHSHVTKMEFKDILHILRSESLLELREFANTIPISQAQEYYDNQKPDSKRRRLVATSAATTPPNCTPEVSASLSVSLTCNLDDRNMPEQQLNAQHQGSYNVRPNTLIAHDIADGIGACHPTIDLREPWLNESNGFPLDANNLRPSFMDTYNHSLRPSFMDTYDHSLANDLRPSFMETYSQLPLDANNLRPFMETQNLSALDANRLRPFAVTTNPPGQHYALASNITTCNQIPPALAT